MRDRPTDEIGVGVDMTWGPQVGGDGPTEEVHLGDVKTYQK